VSGSQNNNANLNPTAKDDKMTEIKGGYHGGVDDCMVAKLLHTSCAL
jgi:hypothetical protein